MCRRWCWFVMLCVTGTSCAIIEPKSFSADPTADNHVRNTEGGIRRFACPVGFFRLKRNCYYLSVGTANWRDAYFHCKDRNATLATIDKKGNDRILRKYLMGDQFTKLERWIGGIYNWRRMAWEWGESGEKIVFQNFDRLEAGDPKQYAWHCIVMDPSRMYKWRPKSCVELKHYMCEVPAGRIGRKRKKRIDENLVPQNQRQKPKKGKKYRTGEGKNGKRNRVQKVWKRDRERQNRNEPWANGVRLGSRPPPNMRYANGTRMHKRTRHRPNRIRPGSDTPKITQISPQGQEYGSYLGDGPARAHHQALSDDNAALNQVHGKISDMLHEEVLLKP